MTLLGIYLNDHLAGATAGRDLARRAASSNRATSYGPFLEDLADQIQEDRDALLQIAAALGVRVDRLKVLGGWWIEKLGRLKLNGRLLGYSPLSRLVELDGLALGVHAKLALWTVLKDLEAAEPRLQRTDLRRLIERAELQLEGLQAQRSRAATEAFA